MIRVRTLENGLRIATEPIEGVMSCGVGVWIDLGSRDEHDDEGGLTHFVEHMLFKGTQTQDARQIADTLNALGGNSNAFTTQEVLCLHARTVARKAHLALDLLAEMLVDSIFPEDEITRERKVILEEYSMYEDSPDELSVDVFMRNLWPRHPLGRPVLGERKSIRAFSRPRVMKYWRREFDPSRIVVALAGAYDARACNDVIRKRFAELKPHSTARQSKRSAMRSANGVVDSNGAPQIDAKINGKHSASHPLRPKRSYLKRPVEQVHFCLGCLAPNRREQDRFAFGLMNMVLGGGMSSRLFQEVREKRGLAYSIGSFTQLFSDRGAFAVSGGTSLKTLDEVVKITLAEMGRLCSEDVPERELDLAREQVLDAMLLGQENTETRMMRMADSLLGCGRIVKLDEAMDAMRAVTTADLRRVARQYLQGAPLALGSVGPLEGGWPKHAPFVVA